MLKLLSIIFLLTTSKHSPELLALLAGPLAVEGVAGAGGGPVVAPEVGPAVARQLAGGRVLYHHHPGGTRAWGAGQLHAGNTSLPLQYNTEKAATTASLCALSF